MVSYFYSFSLVSEQGLWEALLKSGCEMPPHPEFSRERTHFQVYFMVDAGTRIILKWCRKSVSLEILISEVDSLCKSAVWYWNCSKMAVLCKNTNNNLIMYLCCWITKLWTFANLGTIDCHARFPRNFPGQARILWVSYTSKESSWPRTTPISCLASGSSTTEPQFWNVRYT